MVLDNGDDLVRLLVKALPAKRRILDTTLSLIGPDRHVALFYRFLTPVIEATTGSRNLHGGYFETGRESWHEAQERLTTFLGERCGFGKDHHLLDVGCGVGGAAATLVTHTGSRVTGLNLSRSQLRRADLWLRNRGIRNRVLLIRGNATAMPFRWPQFHHAYAIESLSHIPNKDVVVGEVARVTLPGARFGVLDACAENLDALSADPDFAFFCSSWGVRRDGWATPEALPAAFARHGFELLANDDITPHVGPSARAQADYARRHADRFRDAFGGEVLDIILDMLEVTERYVTSGLITYRLWIGQKRP